jgi:mono/diheme cytochrome c family protein
MRFLRDALITIVVLVLVVWVVVYVRLRAGALTADAEPGGIERAVASRLVRLSIPADVGRHQNPFAADPTAWRGAAEHYADHCAICHGRDGHGKTEMGQNMYPKVPDLADQGIQRFSDGALFYIIQNGVRWTGMPAWKNEHSAEETWKLVSLIRKIPSLTPQELESLEKASHKESPEPNKKPTGHEHKHPDSSRTPQ